MDYLHCLMGLLGPVIFLAHVPVDSGRQMETGKGNKIGSSVAGDTLFLTWTQVPSLSQPCSPCSH